MKLIRRLSLGVAFLVTAAAQAASPADAPAPAGVMIGDWDLGPTSTTALRISLKDANDIFVQFCDRNELINQHICNANVIFYFGYSQASGFFVHDDNGSQHLHCTLQIDSVDPTVIHYSFKSDVAVGAMAGKKL